MGAAVNLFGSAIFFFSLKKSARFRAGLRSLWGENAIFGGQKKLSLGLSEHPETCQCLLTVRHGVKKNFSSQIFFFKKNKKNWV